ncbi:hypothetical protein NEUTE1DRAFT_47920 [Neurospora tetrasperma FGSC 2508]|uniref:Uncharacterized protein n=1 Tax=Neurospora tetrasperma (strain FGSC 2508 / ATCC MYA-4615 / P0657) TaxID=510951 RepID=F8MTD1_NEUT8|nr:uncharacterized protein NEUTE1DRAFT_47920 [Neurospora tetrasperma FGSC 2508]EGO55263.1 hypothetical protein NEUTE1DRAFT_47920 [Neurospora tetrasperma FGSC 2508]EGZ69518.1 hypothetical protein NEUTE2DRAFT_70334 [Neurospora tetrasperma FGSC 2509]
MIFEVCLSAWCSSVLCNNSSKAPREEKKRKEKRTSTEILPFLSDLSADMVLIYLAESLELQQLVRW